MRLMDSGLNSDLVHFIRQSYSLDFGSYGKHIDKSAELLVKRVYGDCKSFLTSVKLAKLAFYVQKQEKL